MENGIRQIVTEDGVLGTAQALMRIDDTIVGLDGIEHLIVLRKVVGDDTWRIIGRAILACGN